MRAIGKVASLKHIRAPGAVPSDCAMSRCYMVLYQTKAASALTLHIFIELIYGVH